MKISAKKNSSQAFSSVKIAVAVSPGAASGKDTRTNDWKRLAPSIRAASSSSIGTLSK